MTTDADFSQGARVQATMWNIRIDAATAELVEALAARGVDALILKGPALREWYPETAARVYVDGDVLVAPEHLETAEQTLQGLGFARELDDTGLPDWWQEHATGWKRERDRAAIDLHRILQGTTVPADQAWARLWRDRVPFEVAGRAAHRLADPALAMYVALHAAHHGAEHGGGLAHLEAALGSVDRGVWGAASGLAAELGATDAFSAGLRLLPAGRELADELRLPSNRSVRVELLAATPPPVALGFEQLSAAGPLARLMIVLRKVFPPPGFVRYWWPPADRGPGMLVVGYGYRLIWLARNAPRGWRAWRAARRAVSERTGSSR